MILASKNYYEELLQEAADSRIIILGPLQLAGVW